MGEGPEKVLPAAGSRAGPWVRVTAWRSGCVEAVTQRSLFFLRFPSLRPRGCGERKVPQGGGGGTMIVKISIFRRSALVEWAPESVGSSLWVTPLPLPRSLAHRPRPARLFGGGIRSCLWERGRGLLRASLRRWETPAPRRECVPVPYLPR